MPGRTLPPEHAFSGTPYASPDLARRRQVLRETLAAFETRGEELRRRAQVNLARWHAEATPQPREVPLVLPSDWGAATLDLTRRYGVPFAVLNMANAFVPGGAYVEGTAAQEENLFRRTDAHFHVSDDQMVQDRYTREMTARLSAEGGRVYLDTTHPRVCIRGGEARDRDDLGYPWLVDEDIFPFFELRAAAQDVRGVGGFDGDEARRRIDAQLETLIEAGVRHAVLSAFGCGAFENPPNVVAGCYRDALEQRAGAFDCLAFAIFHPGYGPDNYSVFRRVLAGQDAEHPLPEG